MGYTSFAVEEYLTAIRLMPVRDEFLAMIYDNLAECYERDELFDIAIGAYRQAYQILRGGSQQIYPLRGIARMCLLQNKKDSALVYYQQALDCALVEQDSSLIGALYHDLAMAYSEKKDYIQADKYVSKAIMIQGQDAVNVCLSKAQIMLNLNKLDSASYFYSKNVDQLDIYGKAVCYDGMHQIAKKRGEWKIATENMDAYRVLYDSMQIMNDNEELNRLMDKHQLEEHRRLLSEHTKMLVFTLVSVFFFLMIAALNTSFYSCKTNTDDLWDSIHQLDGRVTLLEELCKQMNGNIGALQTLLQALQSNVSITKVNPVTEGGKTVGYTISFSKGDPITIYHGEKGDKGDTGIAGKDGVTPVVGVRRDTDNVYYWTLNGEWLIDDAGNKVKAVGEDGKDGENGIDGKPGMDGITPQLKIENGRWWLSMNNGSTWSNIGQATGDTGKDGVDGDDMFSDIDYTSSQDFVTFTLSNGTVIKLPTWYAFGELQSLCEQMNTRTTSVFTINSRR